MLLMNLLQISDIGGHLAPLCDCRSLLMLPCVSHQARDLFQPLSPSIRLKRIWGWMEGLDYPAHVDSESTLFWIQRHRSPNCFYEIDVFPFTTHYHLRQGWRFQLTHDHVLFHDAELIFLEDRVQLRTKTNSTGVTNLTTFHDIRTLPQLRFILKNPRSFERFQSLADDQAV